MFDREERERQPPYGPALDLGCGTGMQAVELARRGWQVTAVESFRRLCAPRVSVCVKPKSRCGSSSAMSRHCRPPLSAPASSLCWTSDVSTA
ncbi:MAG: Methyltransferase type 11 [Nitrospira sp.]|nr:Methyltransferase type 11 [Nitrospira sp.]